MNDALKLAADDMIRRLRINVEYYRSMEAVGPAKDDEDAITMIERLWKEVKHLRVTKL